MKKTIIVDYNLGNLFSVNQALMNVGVDVVISQDANDIHTADAVVLPGVGAFQDAMKNLNSMDLVKPIREFLDSGKPFLGVCLGMQLLFDQSEEFGECKGLGVIPGEVKKFSFPDEPAIKVPQIAWNSIYKREISWEKTPLEGQGNADMYFVHSYYVLPKEATTSLAYTRYENFEYTSSIQKDNVFACQFHPEKSAAPGIDIYRKWAHINNLI